VLGQYPMLVYVNTYTIRKEFFMQSDPPMVKNHMEERSKLGELVSLSKFADVKTKLRMGKAC